MNIGNILKVANAIEQASVPGLGFNLSNYAWEANADFPDMSGKDCGTCACIAGWAVAVSGGRAPVPHAGGDIHGIAATLFDIDSDLSFPLFLPGLQEAYGATPAHAARVLRNLTITGKVDWAAAMKDDEPVMPSLPSPLPAKRERV